MASWVVYRPLHKVRVPVAFLPLPPRINSYATPVKNLMYAIAAVVALVGAFNVYFKMQNGDQDVKKTIMMTIGGCVAMVAMAIA